MKKEMRTKRNIYKTGYTSIVVLLILFNIKAIIYIIEKKTMVLKRKKYFT